MVVDWSKLAPGVLAALLIVVAISSGSWLTSESMMLEARVGLREIGVCIQGHCQWQALNEIPGASAYKTIGSLAYFVGWAAFLSVVVGTGLRVVLDVDGRLIQRVQIGCSGTFGVLSVLAVIVFPSGAGMSMSYAILLALGGSLAGVWAAVTIGSSDGGWGRSAVFVPQAVAGQDDLDDAVARRMQSLDTESSEESSEESTAQEQTHDGAQIPFVAVSLEFDLDGVSIVFEEGRRARLLWSQVTELVARRLPPEPPHLGATFMDIVASAAQTKVVRLQASTEVNYLALPGGAGMTPRENFRKLAQLVREQNPCVQLEAESSDFFDSEKQAPQLAAVVVLERFDERYRCA